MSGKLDYYRERVAGTNIDPRSLLSNDYFNHFNTVIMLLGMLPEAPELIDEIEAWQYLSYIDHFRASGLDFAPLAIEAYAHAPSNLRDQFDKKVGEMKTFIEVSRLELRQLLATGKTAQFGDMALRISRELQSLVDAGGAIVHGHDASLDQSAIDKMF